MTTGRAMKGAMPLDPLTIIAALVALLVIWKLRSVLGERTGVERPPRNPFVSRNRTDAEPPQGTPQGAVPPQSVGRPSDGVIRLPGAAQPAAPDPARWKGFAEPGSPVAAGLDAVAAVDPSFTPGSFLEGAKIAYEAVITAFAAGERKTLQNLLAKDVYASFSAALDERKRHGETMSTTFVSMDDAKIESAALEGRTASVAVRFGSKQISATHSADGKLTDGSPDRTVDMDDIWTFAREVSSRDPNWKLVATQSGR